MSWHVYCIGEPLEAEVGGRWLKATFVDEIMPPSHKGIVELTETGERIATTRDHLRPIGQARGRVA